MTQQELDIYKMAISTCIMTFGNIEEVTEYNFDFVVRKYDEFAKISNQLGNFGYGFDAVMELLREVYKEQKVKDDDARQASKEYFEKAKQGA